MKDIVKPSDDKRVLVIGNGFDLDLGWNTRFSDFASSKYWPQNRHKGSILEYLTKIYFYLSKMQIKVTNKSERLLEHEKI